MYCQNCKKETTTYPVSLYQIIGLLILFNYKHLKGNLCHDCANEYYRKYSLTTALLGWWSLISFFITPFVLLINTINISGFGKGSQHITQPLLSKEVMVKLLPYKDEIISQITNIEYIEPIASEYSIKTNLSKEETALFIKIIYYAEQIRSK